MFFCTFFSPQIIPSACLLFRVCNVANSWEPWGGTCTRATL